MIIFGSSRHNFLSQSNGKLGLDQANYRENWPQADSTGICSTLSSHNSICSDKIQSKLTIYFFTSNNSVSFVGGHYFQAFCRSNELSNGTESGATTRTTAMSMVATFHLSQGKLFCVKKKCDSSFIQAGEGNDSEIQHIIFMRAEFPTGKVITHFLSQTCCSVWVELHFAYLPRYASLSLQ